MLIQFQAHHAEISDTMRARAEREVRRAAQRIPRVVAAVIRFESDGTRRRVLLAFRAPKHHDLIAGAEGRFFGPVLAQALSRVLAQASRERKGTPKARARRLARTTR